MDRWRHGALIARAGSATALMVSLLVAFVTSDGSELPWWVMWCTVAYMALTAIVIGLFVAEELFHR